MYEMTQYKNLYIIIISETIRCTERSVLNIKIVIYFLCTFALIIFASYARNECIKVFGSSCEVYCWCPVLAKTGLYQ
jgi:hypothetical protein